VRAVILLVPILWFSVAAQVQFSPAQRPGLPPQDQTGKASIEGSVLDAMTREPVKKAAVSLNGGIRLFVVTDASGHFAFRQLLAGQYFVQASNDKYPSMQQVSVSLAADEQKQDLTVLLTPAASVRGRIVDEDGSPMPRCNVSAMQFRDTETGRTLQQSGFSQSDEKGEYRIFRLQGGKYYINAHCNRSIPLPHPFVRRTSTTDVPTLAYAPTFYPGVADLVGAVKVEASPGGDVAGIDFRMAPAKGVTVQGHTNSAGIDLTLTPRDPMRSHTQQHVRIDAATGEFRIANVIPGSYDLIAFAPVEGISYFAKVPVEVGDAPLDPIEVALTAAPQISGSISIEGDTKVPFNSMRVTMNPLEGGPMPGPPAQAEVQSDGSFVLKSVTPGRSRLMVNGAPGYVKSVRQGDQDVPPWDIEIGSSPVQLKVVIGTKLAQIDAALAAGPAGTDPVSALIWSANGDPQFQQSMGLNQQGRSKISVPPGKYHACAFAGVQPGALMQNRALRKAVESHCETVEASEEGVTQVQLPLIPAADLKQLLDKIEE
jgi:hypothetical protein